MGEAGADERGGAGAHGGDPERVEVVEQTDEQRGGSRTDDAREGVERLARTHEALEIDALAFADFGKQGVARGHAGNVTHGAEQPERHEPTEGESHRGVYHGQQGHAERGDEVGSDADGLAIDAVEHRAAHDTEDELRYGANERERSGSQGIARAGQQDERQHHAGDGIAEQRQRIGDEVAQDGAFEHEVPLERGGTSRRCSTVKTPT